MKKVIKLNERDITRMVMETINSIQRDDYWSANDVKRMTSETFTNTSKEFWVETASTWGFARANGYGENAGTGFVDVKLSNGIFYANVNGQWEKVPFNYNAL